MTPAAALSSKPSAARPGSSAGASRDCATSAAGSADVAGTAGQARVVVEFDRAGSFVFQAEDCTVAEIDDKAALGRTVVERYRNEDWDPGWCVRDRLVRAGSATIMVVSSAGSRVELAGSAAIADPMTQLADARLGPRLHGQRGEVTQMIAQQALTPLFTAARLRTSLLGRLLRPRGTIRFGGRPAAPAAAALGPVDGDDMWEEAQPDSHGPRSG